MVDKFIWIVFLVIQVSPVSPFPGRAIGANLTEQRHFRFRRQEKIDCNKLNINDNVKDIIRGKCTTLATEGNGYYEFKMDDAHAHVKEKLWNSFAASLQSITRINFIFDGSPLTTINFPRLQTVKESLLQFKRNPHLTSINVNVPNKLDAALNITDNPKLETVTLGAGADGLTGGVYIERNNQLKTINMDTLVKIIVEDQFYIGYNEMLKELKMDSLRDFGTKSFELRGNKALEKFEPPKLYTFLVDRFTIAKNDKLSAIRFSNAFVVMAFTVELVQNKKLETIEQKMDAVKPKNLRIRGNPKLGKGVLDAYAKITGLEKNEIQVVGECLFDELIKDLADLDDCVIINSALKFDKRATGTTTNNKLKTIKGDVDLAGLDSKQAAFLAGITIEGTIRSDVCDFQLGNHQVESPKCPPTKKTTTTTSKTAAQTRRTPSSRFSATTKLAPFVKPSKATPSGSRNSTEEPPASGESTAKTNGSKAGLIGGVVGGAVLIMVILIVACCCVRVPAGGGRLGRVKMYMRVFPCVNSKSTIDRGISTKEEASKSGGNKRPAEVRGKTASRGSAQITQESKPLLKPDNKVKTSAAVISSKKEETSKGSGKKQEEKRQPEVGRATISQRSAQVSQLSTRQPESTRQAEPPREPEQQAEGEAEPVKQGRLRSFLQSISARLPTISLSAKTAKTPAPTDPTVPKGPERFIVTKDGEVLRQPRINYQHELLNKMEDFLGNEENYEDLLEEVKSNRDEVKSSKTTEVISSKTGGTGEKTTRTENNENTEKDPKSKQ